MNEHNCLGEGGFLVTNDDTMASLARSFIDKGYGIKGDRGKKDVLFLGYNYRLSELAAAVLDVQLKKLPEQIEKRKKYAQYIIDGLKDVQGITVLDVDKDGSGSFWFVLSYLDLTQFKVGRSEISTAISKEGSAVWDALAPSRILYEVTALAENKRYPFAQAKQKGIIPQVLVAERITDSCLSIVCEQFFSQQDAIETCAGIKKVLDYYHI